MGDAILFTPQQLDTFRNVTKTREATRIADEILGHADIEIALGNIEVSEKLRLLAESIRPQPLRRKLTPEEARKEGERLLKPGMESLPFVGYDPVDDANLPPVRERDDSEEMHALLRRL